MNSYTYICYEFIRNTPKLYDMQKMLRLFGVTSVVLLFVTVTELNIQVRPAVIVACNAKPVQAQSSKFVLLLQSLEQAHKGLLGIQATLKQLASSNVLHTLLLKCKVRIPKHELMLLQSKIAQLPAKEFITRFSESSCTPNYQLQPKQWNTCTTTIKDSALAYGNVSTATSLDQLITTLEPSINEKLHQIEEEIKVQKNELLQSQIHNQADCNELYTLPHLFTIEQ